MIARSLNHGLGFVNRRTILVIGENKMDLVLLLVILIVVFGIGGGAYVGPRYAWGYPGYGGLGFVLLIVVLVILLARGRL